LKMRASRLLLFEQSTQGEGSAASQSMRGGPETQVVLSPDAQKVQAALRVCQDQEDSLRAAAGKWASELEELTKMRDRISARAAEVDAAQEVLERDLERCREREKRIEEDGRCMSGRAARLDGLMQGNKNEPCDSKPCAPRCHSVQIPGSLNISNPKFLVRGKLSISNPNVLVRNGGCSKERPVALG
jgi:hypothetical protein